MTMSSPPVLVWTSWSLANSASKGTPVSGVVFGPCPSFQIWNVGWDACSFDVVATGCEVIFNEMDLSLNDGEFITEVSESVVSTPISFNLCCRVPVVEVGDGVMEGVVCGSGTIEEGVEPDGEWLGNVM